MKQKVVIIGEYENNRLAMIRPLGEMGYDISVIAVGNRTNKNLDSYSKYISNYYIYNGYDELGVVDFLMNFCKDDSQKVVLIPIDDLSTIILDNSYNKLKDFFLLPNIHEEQGAIIKWMNKDLQKSYAVKQGLNVVDSIIVKIVKGSYILPVGIKYPCFTKTQYYVRGTKQFLCKCNNEAELIQILDSICEQQADISVLIEDFKEIEREFSVGGFSDGNDVIIPGVIEKQTIANGVTMTGRIVPIKGYEELIEKFKKFIRGIGFVGIFDIDFFCCRNEFYFCELNFRYGGTGYAYIKKGVFFPEMLVRTLSGKTINDIMVKITSVSRFVNEKVCLKNWYVGKMTTKDYLHIMKSSDLFLYKDILDPIPEKMFKRNFIKLRLKRMVKKMIRKLIVK